VARCGAKVLVVLKTRRRIRAFVTPRLKRGCGDFSRAISRSSAQADAALRFDQRMIVEEFRWFHVSWKCCGVSTAEITVPRFELNAHHADTARRRIHGGICRH